MRIFSCSSRGGEKPIKTGVKLVCKTDFIGFAGDKVSGGVWFL